MKIKGTFIYTLIASCLLFISCNKEGKDLPAPAEATFEMTQYIDPNDPGSLNTYIFKNTTAGGFISSWDFGGVKTSKKMVDTVFFGYTGTYTIKLTTTSQGGYSTATKDLVINQNSPYAADFTIENIDAHNFKVTVSTPGPFDQTFKYANGDSSKALIDTVYYPWQGTFNITLKVVTSKGASFITKQVTVASDDASNPALSDTVFTFLTGGISNTAGKTWILDTSSYSGGVGPIGVVGDLSWWNMPDGFHGSAWDNGMAQNEFTFKLREYKYEPLNNKATIHFAFANKYFGKSQGQYQDIALTDPNHTQAPFILWNANNGVGTGYRLYISNLSYIGYNEHRPEYPEYRYVYDIVSINNDVMYIRHSFNDDANAHPNGDGGARYFTLLRKN